VDRLNLIIIVMAIVVQICLSTGLAPAVSATAAIYDAVSFETLDLGRIDEAWRVDRGSPRSSPTRTSHSSKPTLTAPITPPAATSRKGTRHG
jgi:hypothetical protein